jgi:hypothetical protein
MHVTVSGVIMILVLAYTVSLVVSPIVYAIRELRKAKARLVKEHA